MSRGELRARAPFAQRALRVEIADARLIFAVASVGRPLCIYTVRMPRDYGARPVSTTAVTPSIVTEDSATLVDRMTRRWPERSTARACSATERSP